MTPSRPTPGTAPPRRLAATFNGEPIEAEQGQSIAAALMAAGIHAWRDTRGGSPRGLFCGIGVCFDCLVTVDGESGQRACMIPLAEGMEVTAHPAATEAASPVADSSTPEIPEVEQ